MNDIFPQSIKAPKLVRPYGLLLGYCAAGISTIFAVLHLIRIDLLIPKLDEILSAGTFWASILVIFIVMAEVFAVPFAMRMKLSPLGHIASGAQIVFAPLLWMLVTLWSYGTNLSTGQFTSFIDSPYSIWLVVFNAIWLGLGFATLWALGYNRLKLPRITSVK